MEKITAAIFSEPQNCREHFPSIAREIYTTLQEFTSQKSECFTVIAAKNLKSQRNYFSEYYSFAKSDTFSNLTTLKCES
jgi:hypothetical protein